MIIGDTCQLMNFVRARAFICRRDTNLRIREVGHVLPNLVSRSSNYAPRETPFYIPL